jgi:uncharacterized membrane-anchored protein YitT (DUF2179 family)
MKQIKKFTDLILIAILAAASAFNYTIFIFPNRFAPAGIDGICTMVQDITGISIGYLSLMVNIPLLIIAWIKLDRDYAVKSSVFILAFSAVAAILSEIDLGGFYYHTESSTSIVLAPIASGVIRGIIYAITIALNGSSGGIDIVAALIRKKAPHFNLMNIIFALNMGVAVCSYFVYGHQLEPVICGILYFYITSQTSSSIQASRKENAKIEIITPGAVELCHEITSKLNLSATVLDSRGAYSGSTNKMVVCIAEKKFIPQIKDAVNRFPDAVYFVSTVTESHMHKH